MYVYHLPVSNTHNFACILRVNWIHLDFYADNCKQNHQRQYNTELALKLESRIELICMSAVIPDQDDIYRFSSTSFRTEYSDLFAVQRISI